MTLESPVHYITLPNASISGGNSINSSSYPFKGIGVLKLILRSAGWFTKFELDTTFICVMFAPSSIVKERSVSTEFTI